MANAEKRPVRKVKITDAFDTRRKGVASRKPALSDCPENVVDRNKTGFKLGENRTQGMHLA